MKPSTSGNKNSPWPGLSFIYTAIIMPSYLTDHHYVTNVHSNHFVKIFHIISNSRQIIIINILLKIMQFCSMFHRFTVNSRILTIAWKMLDRPTEITGMFAKWLQLFICQNKLSPLDYGREIYYQSLTNPAWQKRHRIFISAF